MKATIHRQVCAMLGTRPRVYPSGAICYNPTTAGLRRLLHDRRTPRVIKNQVYAWLRYRRAARS